MTTGIFQPVSFRYFFGLCRCLWLVCRLIQNDVDNNANRLAKAQLMIDLYKEYIKFNESIDEYHYCANQIELGNSLLNPLNYDLNPFAFKVQVTNCFYLNL